MQIFETELPVTDEQIRSLALLLPCPLTDVCFFDIETTGLSPKISNVYLIGAARFGPVDTLPQPASVLSGEHPEKPAGRFLLTQWFADDYTSESDLIRAFSEYLSSCSLVVHYNGTTFDIPYLEKKCLEHSLISPFTPLSPAPVAGMSGSSASHKPETTEDRRTGIVSLDLYRHVSAHKSIFPTENHKLITMEHWLGFDRGENSSGKECIQLYAEYMLFKYAHRDLDMNSRLKIILKHNRDDLMGTILSSQILYYTDYQPVEPGVTPEERAVFTDKLPDGLFFPAALTYDNPILPGEAAHIRYEGDTLTVTVPLFQGTLYHFFPDYKNYYYLPDEDMAVHKSVGSFVDREHRVPATSQNCYTKKSGLFLPLPARTYPDRLPVFYQKNRAHSPEFIDVNDISGADKGFLMKAFLM